MSVESLNKQKGDSSVHSHKHHGPRPQHPHPRAQHQHRDGHAHPHQHRDGHAHPHQHQDGHAHPHQQHQHPPGDQSSGQRGHRPRAGTWHGKDGLSSGNPTPGNSRQRAAMGLADDKSDFNPNNMPVEFENTYKLEPDCRFPEREARQIIENVLEQNLHDKKYDPNIMNRKCRTLSDMIKDRIKEMNLERFKIVTSVMITEKQHQAMQVVSRCIWDQRWDNYACGVYSNKTLYAIGLVYVVYYE
ncbi:tctex1 domain-containing protein 1 [Lingula anatina]|uniref:Tctex1 domain-containing protein 1 n=1 Tax=Lingula anatina TaxID=7574 RepID=A0A1S3H965_LINAN|nr:tctex1 domain-containing protein 1 [Lingula anatina]|eukprot:XP_013382553.1 tctex1 domain-containing protein 1 [Lingula anatina]